MRELIILLAVGLFLTSCDISSPCTSNEKMLSSMDALIKEIENGNITDWTSYDERFDKLTEVCYPKLSESMNIGDKLSYYKDVIVYSAERGIKDYELDEIMKRAGTSLEEELELLGSQGQEELKEFINENVAPELEKMIDDVLKGLEDFGDDLKQALDELAN